VKRHTRNEHSQAEKWPAHHKPYSRPQKAEQNDRETGPDEVGGHGDQDSACRLTIVEQDVCFGGTL